MYYSYMAVYGAELAKQFCLWLWVEIATMALKDFSFSSRRKSESFVEDAKMSILLLLAT